MKVGYIVALLMIVLMVGCATQTETPPAAPAAEPVAPAAEPVAPVAPAAEPAAPVAEPAAPAAEPAAPVLTDADQARIESLKASCKRGAVSLCLVLKNTYGIDWPPKVAEEPPEVAAQVTE